MKNIIKIYILFFLLFQINFSNAQQGFKTSIVFSSGISKLSSTYSDISTLKRYKYNQNRGINFAYLIGIKENYFFSGIFSLGISINYLITKGNFVIDKKTPYPEHIDLYKHTISIQSIQIPISLGLRTKEGLNKGIFFNLGVEPDYIIHSKRNIIEIAGYFGPAPKDKSKIENSKNNFKNTLGLVGFLEVGKNFIIGKTPSFCTLQYQLDLTPLQYPTVNNPQYDYFNLRRNILSLNLGMRF